MTPKLTPEMRAALEERSGLPVEVRDEQTDRVYLLFDREQARDLLDRWIVQELGLAESDIAAGRVSAWDRAGIMRQVQASASLPQTK